MVVTGEKRSPAHEPKETIWTKTTDKQDRKEATSQSVTKALKCGLGADSTADMSCRAAGATLASELHTGWQGHCSSRSDIKVKGWL